MDMRKLAIQMIITRECDGCKWFSKCAQYKHKHDDYNLCDMVARYVADGIKED